MKSFKVYADDVFIVTEAKCGTTLMQELAWLIANDVDLEKAELNQFFRVPYLDLQHCIGFAKVLFTTFDILNRYSNRINLGFDATPLYKNNNCI